MPSQRPAGAARTALVAHAWALGTRRTAVRALGSPAGAMMVAPKPGLVPVVVRPPISAPVGLTIPAATLTPILTLVGPTIPAIACMPVGLSTLADVLEPVGLFVLVGLAGQVGDDVGPAAEPYRPCGQLPQIGDFDVQLDDPATAG